MIRLIYSGSLVRSPSREQVSEFLVNTRLRNQRKKISGVLILMGRNFLQVIEGPEVEIDYLYSRLVQETQRYSLILLSRQYIREAVFHSWSLGFIDAASHQKTLMNADNPELRVLQELQHIKAPDETAQHTLKLINEFINGKWQHRSQRIQNPILLRH